MSSIEPHGNPLNRKKPAEVPCSNCGEWNYIEENKGGVICFKCKEACYRTSGGGHSLTLSEGVLHARAPMGECRGQGIGACLG